VVVSGRSERFHFLSRERRGSLRPPRRWRNPVAGCTSICPSSCKRRKKLRALRELALQRSCARPRSSSCASQPRNAPVVTARGSSTPRAFSQPRARRDQHGKRARVRRGAPRDRSERRVDSARVMIERVGALAAWPHRGLA
jgi:hypothetical protein